MNGIFTLFKRQGIIKRKEVNQFGSQYIGNCHKMALVKPVNRVPFEKTQWINFPYFKFLQRHRIAVQPVICQVQEKGINMYGMERCERKIRIASRREKTNMTK